MVRNYESWCGRVDSCLCGRPRTQQRPLPLTHLALDTTSEQGRNTTFVCQLHFPFSNKHFSFSSISYTFLILLAHLHFFFRFPIGSTYPDSPKCIFAYSFLRLDPFTIRSDASCTWNFISRIHPFFSPFSSLRSDLRHRRLHGSSLMFLPCISSPV